MYIPPPKSFNRESETLIMNSENDLIVCTLLASVTSVMRSTRPVVVTLRVITCG